MKRGFLISASAALIAVSAYLLDKDADSLLGITTGCLTTQVLHWLVDMWHERRAGGGEAAENDPR
jgi:hypothetical protein